MATSQTKDTLDRLKHSYGGYRGHFTLKRDAAHRFILGLDLGNLVPDHVDRARVHLTNLQAAFDKAEDACGLVLNTLAASGPDAEASLARWKERLQELVNLFEEMEKKLYDVIQRGLQPAAPQPPPPVAPAAPAPRQVRPVEALKPFTLNASHSMIEFETWESSFRAYYTTSHIDLASVEEQQAYLRSCMDSLLWVRVKPVITRTTPVFGQVNSCFAALRDEFEQANPLFTRRMDYFKYMQQPGQDWNDMSAQIRVRRDAAQLDALTLDQLDVFRNIQATVDPVLREKFLRLNNPTYQDLQRCARAYMQGKKNMASEAVTVSPVNKVSVNDQPQRRNVKKQQAKGNIGSNNAPLPRPLTWEALNKRCVCCGDPNHKRDTCKQSNAVCNLCQKSGHIARVCMSSSKKPTKISSVEATVDAVEDEPPTYSSSTEGKPTPRLLVTLSPGPGPGGTRITLKQIRALPDSGAARSLLNSRIAQKMGLVAQDTNLRLIAANGTSLETLGTAFIQVSTKTSSLLINAVITPDINDDLIIGWSDLINLKCLPQTFPHPTPAIHKVSIDNELTQLNKDFADVLSDTLTVKPMKGPAMHINLKRNVPVKPHKTLTARQIPLHWQAEAEKVVQAGLKAGIFAKLAPNETTDWLSPAFFVPKEGGKAGLRLVTDYTRLNNYIDRPVHPFPSAPDIMRKIKPDSKVFAKLDCTQGYFQVPLDEESSYLTTFILPSGRYRYLRAPMGLNAAGDFWCFSSDEALVGLEWADKIVDDILIQAPDYMTLFSRIRTVLTRCREHGITISKRKLKIGTKIPFAGYIVSHEGVRPDPELFSAISHFPTPTTITHLRSFLGLANQLGNFLPDLAHASEPLRPLLQKKSAFVWLPEHETAFNHLKTLLTSAPLIAPFDPSLPTKLITDASRLKGFGFALLQHHGSTPKLVQCGSRTLSAAERNYATVELECAAFQWAVEKCHFFLRGNPNFSIVTDHKPLLGLFSKALHDIPNPRVLRYREKLLPYSFTLEWTPGKLNPVADALSRHPLFEPPEQISTVLSLNPTQTLDPMLADLANDCNALDEYTAIYEILLNGTDPANFPPSHPANTLKSYWSRLSANPLHRLILLDAHRLYIPFVLRSRILKLLHLSHCGLTKTKALAKLHYFWPGMSSDIKSTVNNCLSCQTVRPSQPRPEITTQEPQTYPFSHVGIDLCSHAGKTYLVLVDRHSGYPLVKLLRSLNTVAVTNSLYTWFLTYGFPLSVRTDNGPQFLSEFDSWCKKYHIIHERSSPYNPESNGLAEAAVKSVKHLLKTTLASKEDFETALAAWRSTPRQDNLSPNDLMFNRKIRTFFPIACPSALQYDNPSNIHTRLNSKQHSLDNKAHTKAYPAIPDNTTVLLQNPTTKLWDTVGTVVSSQHNGQSYTVVSGQHTFVRNRQFIKVKPT